MAVAELPDDVDALKAMIVAMAEQRASAGSACPNQHHLEVVNKTADERIATLTAIVRMLERSRYGTRSERLRGATVSDEQHRLRVRRDQDRPGGDRSRARKQPAQDKPKRAPRPRKGFAAHLERVEIVIEPGDSRRLRGAGEGSDRRGRVGASGRDAGEVPGDRHAPPEIRLPGPRWRDPGAGATPISSRAASPPKRFWLRSPSPNMPMVCRSIGRKPSMRGTRSSWTAR